MPEVILPGTYVTVRDEGLITAGSVSTGNIGIVGTAAKGPLNVVQIIGSMTEAKAIFGEADAWNTPGTPLTLIRSLQQIYANGGRAVYAVRVSDGNESAAAFQTMDGATALVQLTANSPGTWGNEIKILIDNATQPAFINEMHPVGADGVAFQLNRTNVVNGSGLNRISLEKGSTGQIINFDIIYTGTVDDTENQVLINPGTGALTFTALAGSSPVTGDKIFASFEVPTANARKVELYYQAQKEVYTIADSADLATQVRSRSNLVTAPEANESLNFNELPDTTSNLKLLFSGPPNGTAGSDGANANASHYAVGLGNLEQDIINIVMLAGQDASNGAMVAALLGHINSTSDIRRERIAVIGSNGSSDVNTVAGHNLASDRVVYVGPGVKVSNAETLPGSYTAAAVVGLLSRLPVQTSPTNKILNVPGLAAIYSSAQLEKLVQNRVLAIEKRNGFRIVKGITTATNSAWHQITTRRIVDYATYGVRSACNPYIGKLNNERVRGAMKATIDAFLTRMVNDESLISYELEVSATRAQQIAGEAIVTMTIRPTFSIDFIKVTMYLG